MSVKRLQKSLIFAIILIGVLFVGLSLPKSVLASTVGDFVSKVGDIPGNCERYIDKGTNGSIDLFDEIEEGKDVQFSACVAGGEVMVEEKEPAVLITNIVRWIMGIIGALAVAFIVYGGFIYITSGGDEKKVAQAKNILLYAIIGFVITVLAQVILWIIIQAIEATP